ncbi:MAG: hypothetical protein KGQ37_01390 [Hyphomicrobiales bacterium]|nr:hypothetical protein [Hyphomicrobiales bacterium]
MQRKIHVAMLLSLLVAGCQSTSGAPDVKVKPPAMPMAAAKPAGPPPVSGALAGALGANMSEKDRRTAFNSLLMALKSGKRQSWRGTGTVFGYATPQKPAGLGGLADLSCSHYDVHVFINGRGRSGSGKACRDADGSWTFTNS